MKYTTRSKITFVAAFSNITLIILALVTFTLFAQYLLNKNVEIAVVTEAEEIVQEHLTISEDRVVYTKSSSDLTLEQHLLTDRLSAKIYNKDSSPIGTFGIFAQPDISDIDEQLLETAVKKTCSATAYKVMTNTKLGSGTYTVLYYPILRNGTCDGTVVVAADTHTTTALINLVIQLSIALLCVAIVVNILVGQKIAQLILTPLKNLTKTMRKMVVDKDPGKVAPLNTPDHDDLSQLVNTFNTMSDRIREGASKQRSFIMDASHELKTPIARAISDIDIAKLSIENMAGARQASTMLTDAQNDLKTISAIIDVLLQAAKLKHAALSFEVINLNELIEAELKDLHEVSKTMDIAITISINTAKVFADRQLLSLIIRNCLGNAIKYNKVHGTLSITTAQIGNTFTLTIINTTINSVTTAPQPESHKLGFNIIKNLCEIANYSMSATTQEEKFTVSIADIPKALAK